jgi:hypothetical protein
MGALPRPDLPLGAHHDLVAALHDLHHRAGWPSLRVLARESGVSHTTVSKVFSAPGLPAWGTLELAVEAMQGDTAAFHDLWLDASAPTGRLIQAAPRIAGRRAELTAVRRHLETGTGLLLVSGEAGMGKTTLVEAAMPGASCFIASGRCLPLSTEVPFLPVVDALRSILDHDDGRWLKEALTKCPAYVRSTLAGLVPDLDADVEPPVRDDPSGRQRLFVSIAAVLRSLTSADPLGLLVEDLHWADTGTLDLLEHLLNTPLRLAVVGTWRLDDATTSHWNRDWFERLARSATVKQLELMPLTEEETAHQLSLLGVELHDDLAARMHARTCGQPLFTEQLATHHEGEAPFPSLLRDLLDRRFVGISDAAWSITRALGIADRPLTADQLTAATGLAHARLVEELRELQRRRLVRTTRLSAAELQHPLLAEAARRRLVAGEAREVHRALAQVLGAEPDASPAEVAAHWEGASEMERELEWRIAAARSSAEAYDTATEAEQWLRALTIWPAAVAAAGMPPVTRAEAYLGAMDALRLSLQFDRAARMSDEAERRLSDSDRDLATRAELLVRAAAFRGAREGMTAGLAVIEEALATYERLPVSAGRVHALLRKHNLLLNMGRYAEAFDIVRAASQAAEEVGHAEAHRETLSWVAWHQGIGGSLDHAVRTMERASSLVAVDSDPAGDIRQAMLMTDMLLMTGQSADAIDAAGQRGLEVAERWKIESSHVLLVRSNMVWGRIRQGRVAAAAELVDALSEESVDIDRASLHLDRAVLDGLRGRGELALQRIASLLDGLGHRAVVTELEFLDSLATVYLWSGAPGEAWTRLIPSLDAAVDWAPACQTRMALLRAAQAGAEVAAADASVAQHHLNTLVALHDRLPRDDASQAYDAQRLPAAYGRALAAGWRAELDRLGGAQVVEHWVAGAEAWDMLARPHDAAYCRWRAAQVALEEGRGTVAARLLRRATSDAREHVPLLDAIGRTAAGKA